MIKQLLLCIACLALVTSPASASFWEDSFDSDTMNSALWFEFNDGNSASQLSQSGGALNFSAIGDGTETAKGYFSNVFTVNWQNDFEARVRYFNAPENEGSSSVMLGLASGSPEESDTIMPMIRAGQFDDFDTSIRGFWAGVDRSDSEADTWDYQEDDAVEGWLMMRYTADEDLLEFAATDLLDPTADDPIFYAYDNFTANYGDDSMTLFLAFNADDSDMAAAMDDFSGQIVVTPEPLSMVLFGLGGLPLAARVLRRTGKQEA